MKEKEKTYVKVAEKTKKYKIMLESAMEELELTRAERDAYKKKAE